MSYNNQYRNCVGILLINKNGDIFSGKRVNSQEDSAWQLPQGGIEKNEDILEAAQRELLEETSISNIKFIRKMSDYIYYDIPVDYIRANNNLSRYRGQKQIWCLYLFAGDDQEIDVLNVTNPEFNEWKWVDWDFLYKNTVKFKIDVYRRIAKEFQSDIENFRNQN